MERGIGLPFEVGWKKFKEGLTGGVVIRFLSNQALRSCGKLVLGWRHFDANSLCISLYITSYLLRETSAPKYTIQ